MIIIRYHMIIIRYHMIIIRYHMIIICYSHLNNYIDLVSKLPKLLKKLFVIVCNPERVCQPLHSNNQHSAHKDSLFLCFCGCVLQSQACISMSFWMSISPFQSPKLCSYKALLSHVVCCVSVTDVFIANCHVACQTRLILFDCLPHILHIFIIPVLFFVLYNYVYSLSAAWLVGYSVHRCRHGDRGNKRIVLITSIN